MHEHQFATLGYCLLQIPLLSILCLSVCLSVCLMSVYTTCKKSLSDFDGIFLRTVF